MKRIVVSAIVGILLMAAVPLWADDLMTVPEDGTLSDPGPKAVHQWLWENKLRPQLIKKQEMAKMLAISGTNWQDYDIYFYSLKFDIDHLAEWLYGETGVYGRAVSTVLDSVVLNMANALAVDSVVNASGALSYNHTGEVLVVYLDRTYNQDEEFEFLIGYNGHPAASNGFLGFSFSSRAGLPLITTLSEPMGARSWWPCNDIPPDKADSVDITVTVDTSLVVSSNGTQISDTDNGDGTHTVYWQERYPIAPYLVSLGVHPYAVWGTWYVYSPTDSMPLTFFVYPDHDAYSRPYFGILPEIMAYQAQRFGEYPFINEKYGCTHFDWGGAMEHQTNTSTTSSSFGYNDDVISHELGHQWWGDMVTCDDWHHIWINEGFATYSEALYHELKYGTDYYHSYMNSFEFGGGGSIYIQDTMSIYNIFGSIVYDKAGWVLHMLRHVVGDSLFFQSLLDYREQYQWKTATTENFRDVVEATSGMDLHWFFEEWIYGTYRPYYAFSSLTEPDPGGGYRTYLHIRQLQTTAPQVFTMPIDMSLETAVDTVVEAVFNDRRTQNFILHTDNNVIDIELDPDRWISRQKVREAYTFHIVTPTLDDGQQLADYLDTVVVRGGSTNRLFEIIGGAMPAGWTLSSNNGIISGQATESGDFTFTVRARDLSISSYRDSLEYTVNLAAAADNPGDANADGDVNTGDVVYMVNFVFKGGPSPMVSNWGDANADCALNVGDAVYLVNFIFKEGDAPQSGCVE